MNSLWPSTRAAPRETNPDGDDPGPLADTPTDDVADTGKVADVGPGPGADELEKPPVPPPPPSPPTRPGLARNSLQPGPQLPPPSPPFLGSAQGRGKQQYHQQQQQQQQQFQQQQQQYQQQQQQGVPAPTDSLSLMQLRRIVAEVNRAEPAAYDFTYSDMGSHAEEIDEWFEYQFWQWVRLNAAQKAFEWHLNQESAAAGGCGAGGHPWEDADNDTRARFVQAAIAGVESNNAALRSASIGKLVYLVLGRWGDTALPRFTGTGAGRSVASPPQLHAIKAGVECLSSLEGLPVIWRALCHCFEVLHRFGVQPQANPQECQDELINLMTIMYITIQETLNDPDDMSSSYGKLLELKPSLVEAMSTVTFRLRWGELTAMPHTQILLLFWKSILLVFGGTRELENLKRATSEMAADPKDKDTITASPLDYHAFRQEIVSKYPAYVPPQSLIPLEPDNNSLLPPLPNLSSRNDASTGIIPTPTRSQSGGASILDQPVHIATPAPSPPPSPGVGGKGGKKQNYQTNQNFPLMYPPLDATSNSAGGKGVAGMHDAVISRRWEGSDIPASILEAGELFSSRVRMSRATRQMWEERERFLKYERGWELESDDDEMVHLDLDELTLEEKQILEELKAEVRKEKSPPHPGVEVDLGPNPERLSDRDKQRLTAVENYYKNALPNMQSLVIVLLRPILVNVTAIVTQQAGKGGGPAMQKGPDSGQAGGADEPELSPEDVDAARMREITTKAMTGILILLLKWFRVSHVLKFEFLTQLLLDSNYIPLVLKLFAHQDIQQVVDSNTDRVENSFFQFCNLRSRVKYKMESDLGNEVDEDEGEAGEGHAEGELSAGDDSDNSDDSAASAPIKRRRSPEQGEGEGEEDPDEDSDEDAEEYAGEYAEEDAGEDADECAEEDAGSDGQSSTRPEVDELGNPVKPLPAEPITDFSRRNFFSLINYLRVMQKICKNKAHRNLLLMQYKSSTILRKSLRIPQEELRLYTLKLFKNQVPFCGRKWRQSNMRVITAVYLHCRPELRDEWLAGSGVDAEVEGALPLEQGLRSLTHWRDVRQYPDRIAPQFHTAMREEEQDFFKRELEKADVNWAAMGADDGTSEMEQAEGWA